MTLGSKNLTQVFEGQVGDAGLAFIVMIILSLPLYMASKRMRARTVCLNGAKLAATDFYDRAEILISDPAVSKTLKNMIYDMALAVTDEGVGRDALETLLESISEVKQSGKISTPKGVLVEELKLLRRSRSDLYDMFHEALRSALASIMFAYGPDHEKVLVNYVATSNLSNLLTHAERLDRALRSRKFHNGEKAKTAAYA